MGWIAFILLIWVLFYGDDVILFDLIKDKELASCVVEQEKPWEEYNEN